MSDEELRRAQEVLLDILRDRRQAMTPHDLLAQAAHSQGRPSAEVIRLALWALLASKLVDQLDDNSIRIKTSHPQPA